MYKVVDEVYTLSMKILNVLILDDDQTQLELMKVMFDKIEYPPCKPVFTSTLTNFSAQFRSFPFDLVITDYFMPDTSGSDVLVLVKRERPDCEVIVLTSGTTTPEAINLMKQGAYDFIIKPISFDLLLNRINKIFELKNLIQENDALLKAIGTKDIPFSDQIIFRSSKMKDVINIAARAAHTDTNILIRGESGTGKELFARGIHFSSMRKDKSFITINIAALPETLIESELFGHVKGSFTGAESDYTGLFEKAHEGTIFIDEAGDIPLSVQTKLLRIIQFGELQKIGSGIMKRVDIRIIAATNKNLEAMIKDKLFREDLFYRLNVIPLYIPPLRERREDIPPLIEHYITKICSKHGKKKAVLTDEASLLLMNYAYPGNIREMENIIEYAVALSRGNVITRKELPAILQNQGPLGPNDSRVTGSSYADNMKHFEMQLLTDVLEKASGNQSAAARALGISERKFRSRMDILGLKNTFR